MVFAGDRAHRWLRRLARLGAGSALVTLVVYLLALNLTAPPGPDEGMYLSAAVLARDHAIYSEFSFPQTPYLPLLLARVLDVSGEASRFAVGRALTLLHHLATLTLLYGIAARYTRSPGFATLFLLVMALQGFVVQGGAALHNSTLANTYALLAFYLMLGSAGTPRAGASFAAGASVAVAVGMKLTYAPIAVAFLVAQLPRAHRRSLPSFASGLTAGALPMLLIAVRDPAAFWFGNVGWHRAAKVGIQNDWVGHVRDAFTVLANPSWVAPLFVLIAFVIAERLLNDPRMTAFLARDGLTVDRLVLSTAPPLCLTLVVATAQFRYWYLEPALYYAALLVPNLYADLGQGAKRRSVALMGVLASVLLLVRSPDALVRMTRALDREQWTVTDIARGADDLLGVLGALGGRRGAAVETLSELSTLYAAEARVALRKTAPTGAFACVHATIPETVRRRFHLGTYADALGALGDGTLDAVALRDIDCSAAEWTAACDDTICRLVRSIEASAARHAAGTEGLRVAIFTRTRRQ